MLKTNHKNGNVKVSIIEAGTRVMEWEGDKNLSFPMNVDIRVMTKCSFGMKPDGSSICDFCHESATTDGKECNYEELYEKISILPKGTELAIGANDLTKDFLNFLEKASKKYICSITINQGHVKKNKKIILIPQCIFCLKGSREEQ